MSQIEIMKQALEALENSVDLYGKYPTRAAKIGGPAALVNAHNDSINALRQAIEQPGEVEPVAYECPKGCGCWWRDNRDGTMSLFNGDHRSCSICENLSLNDLRLVSLADHLFIEHRDGDNWLVCVERVFKDEAEARKACQKWKDYTHQQHQRSL